MPARIYSSLSLSTCPCACMCLGLVLQDAVELHGTWQAAASFRLPVGHARSLQAHVLPLLSLLSRKQTMGVGSQAAPMANAVTCASQTGQRCCTGHCRSSLADCLSVTGAMTMLAGGTGGSGRTVSAAGGAAAGRSTCSQSCYLPPGLNAGRCWRRL